VSRSEDGLRTKCSETRTSANIIVRKKPNSPIQKTALLFNPFKLFEKGVIMRDCPCFLCRSLLQVLESWAWRQRRDDQRVATYHPPAGFVNFHPYPKMKGEFEATYWVNTCLIGGTRWRSWLRDCATSWKVAGSLPDGVMGIFHWHNSSGRSLALGLTQPLTEMSTRNISWGLKAAGA